MVCSQDTQGKIKQEELTTEMVAHPLHRVLRTLWLPYCSAQLNPLRLALSLVYVFAAGASAMLSAAALGEGSSATAASATGPLRTLRRRASDGAGPLREPLSLWCSSSESC